MRKQFYTKNCFQIVSILYTYKYISYICVCKYVCVYVCSAFYLLWSVLILTVTLN